MRDPLTDQRFPHFSLSADGGIPTGGFAAFQAALLRNDPPDRPFRLRRRSGSNPYMYKKTEYLSVPCFRVRRRRDSNAQTFLNFYNIINKIFRLNHHHKG